MSSLGDIASANTERLRDAFLNIDNSVSGDVKKNWYDSIQNLTPLKNPSIIDGKPNIVNPKSIDSQEAKHLWDHIRKKFKNIPLPELFKNNSKISTQQKQLALMAYSRLPLDVLETLENSQNNVLLAKFFDNLNLHSPSGNCTVPLHVCYDALVNKKSTKNNKIEDTDKPEIQDKDKISEPKDEADAVTVQNSETNQSEIATPEEQSNRSETKEKAERTDQSTITEEVENTETEQRTKQTPVTKETSAISQTQEGNNVTGIDSNTLESSGVNQAVNSETTFKANQIDDDLNVLSQTKALNFEGVEIELKSIKEERFQEVETTLQKLGVFTGTQTLNSYIDANFKDISSSKKAHIKRALAAAVLSTGENAKSIGKDKMNTLLLRAGIMAESNPNLTHIKITSGRPPEGSKSIDETYTKLIDEQGKQLSPEQLTTLKDALSIIGTIADPMSPNQKTILIEIINSFEIGSEDIGENNSAQEISKRLALKLQEAKNNAIQDSLQNDSQQEVFQQIKLTNAAIDKFFTKTKRLGFINNASDINSKEDIGNQQPTNPPNK